MQDGGLLVESHVDFKLISTYYHDNDGFYFQIVDTCIDPLWPMSCELLKKFS
jgi:hypothetical protein